MLTKVTSWSAETPCGTYYAENIGGRKWELFKMRGLGKGPIAICSSFKAAVAACPQ